MASERGEMPNECEKKKEVSLLLLRYILPDNCSEAEKEANPIAAEEIVEAIKDGKTVEIINAVIEGPFLLKSVKVEGEVTIQRTKIRGHVDWSYAAFKRVLNLENSIFETDATFTAVTVEKDIFIDNATFLGMAVFSDITVTGVFYSRSTTFKRDAIFGYSTFKKRIEFSESAFECKADFASALIGSDAEFPGAKFKQHAIFNGVQIEGGAFFKSATFEGKADFICTRIGSTAVFTEAEFKQLATFNRTQIEGAAFFDLSIFEGEADFISAQIGNTAKFTKAKFEQQASFNSAQIEGAALFNRVIFEGEADFINARIGSDANFAEAEFVKRVSFNRTQIEGPAFFDYATFKEEVNFVSARIGSNAKFTEAKFVKQAIFNRTQIEESAFFDYAIFKEKVNFVSARIGSAANFAGAEFVKQAIFNRAQLEGGAFFQPVYLFSWGSIPGNDSERLLRFLKDRFDVDWAENVKIIKHDDSKTILSYKDENLAEIVITDKKEKATLKLSDGRTRDLIVKIKDGKLNIWNPTTFDGDAEFGSARIGSDAHFEGAIFAKKVSFQDASLKTVVFGENEGQLGYIQRFMYKLTPCIFPIYSFEITSNTKIDLRGCVYDRIDPPSCWKQLMEHLDPYDRQPFTQLEETFRRAGEDKFADDVYYKRKCRESKNIEILKPGTWLLDRFLWLLTGYGVRLWRLLLAIIPILIIGTFIFHLEGAVELDIQLSSMLSSQATLSCWDAFWVSLNTFLPVEIPSGADWKPSSQLIPALGIKFTTFATLLDLAGWILVPVGVAGISGLLKRSR